MMRQATAEEQEIFFALEKEKSAAKSAAFLGAETAKRRANGEANSPDDDAAKIIYRCIGDVQPRPIEWLWRDRIAKGAATLVVGNPGEGKSHLATSFIAAVSGGGVWPDGTCCTRSKAIILCGEDSVESTLRPRLEAAGADVSAVYVIDAVTDIASNGNSHKRPFSLSADVARLDNLLSELQGVALVVIDPLGAYMGAVDGHKNNEVRAALLPLQDLAVKHNVAIICISHLTKSGGNNALLRVQGSIAFVAACRAAYVVTRDTNASERKLFLPLKNNLGTDRTGFAFAVRSVRLQSGIETSGITWEPEPVTTTADEALHVANADPEERGALDDATRFLRDLLAECPLPAKRIREDADGAGFSWITIHRAATKLGVERSKAGMRGGWIWTLPKISANTKISEDIRHENMKSSANMKSSETDNSHEDFKEEEDFTKTLLGESEIFVKSSDWVDI